MDAAVKAAMDVIADYLNNSVQEVMEMAMDLFHRAAVQGDLTPFRDMVDGLEGLNGCVEVVLNSRNSDGLALFHIAAMGGNTALVEYLLEKGKMDIDVKDWVAGHTALHYAIMLGLDATVTFLLEEGASPNAESQRKRTPLHYAVEYGTARIILLLISRGADVNAVADCGTPLQLAAMHNEEDALKALLEKHANPNRMSCDLITPLIASVVAQSYECMETLLKAGADPNIRGSKGLTALGWAASEEDATDVIECLLNAGADPNVTDNLGMTPLEVAALENCYHNVIVLFPVTSPIPKVPEWSIEGIMEHVHSDDASQERNGKLQECVRLSIEGGDSSLKRKKYFEATQLYSEAIRYDPRNATVMSKQSLCWARLNEGDSAMIRAQACLAHRPQWPEAHLRVGEAWMVLKDFDKAAAAFENGLYFDPNNEELKYAFCEALEAKKNQPVWVFGPEAIDAAVPVFSA